MTIEEGKSAPAFTLHDENSEKVSLKDYAGKDVVLFFYPRDNTPGCTKEACGFRDLHREILATGAMIVGVSPDDAASHQKFRHEHRLPFPLLSDPDRRVMERYGAYGEKTMYGKKVQGVIRSTVWIGPDGKVKKHWKRVANAAAHPEKVLAALSADS